VTDDVVLRRLADDDSITELTALLRRAYGALAERGLRYVATYQEDDETRARAAAGECWVAERDERLVATVTFYPPGVEKNARAPDWYRRADIATFGQLAVDPELQGRGLGVRLLELVEDRARELGATEIACDTAESADHLIELYARRGYRFVGYADWRPATNYRSVVLSKPLD
jgi:GNAT superfamily N-acetyltransferase